MAEQYLGFGFLEKNSISVRGLNERYGEEVKYKKSYCGCFAMYHGWEGTYWRNKCCLRGCHNRQCREIYASRRKKQMVEMAEDNGLDHFFTLTLDPKKFNGDKDCWEKISYVWSLFRRRLGRKYPDIKWFAILEKHVKNDRPHIHGLWNMNVDVVWAREAWQECGGGKQIRFEYVEQGDISGYLSKALNISRYFGKHQMDIAEFIKPGQKIFWYSYNLKRRKKVKKAGYGFIRNHKMFGLSGKKLLSDEECSKIINVDISTNHKEDGKYAEKQVWTELETTFSRVLKECAEKCQPNLETNAGRQESKQSNLVFEEKKTANQCTNQEAERVTMKSWTEYNEELDGKKGKTAGGVKCPAYPNCSEC